MSALDRSLLRLFVHCRERKFVQVARPTDSIGELALDIQSKFSKLYSGDEIKATRLQCTDGFDLDVDDLIADVFQDRDHVYVDLNDGREPCSPMKRSCFRSPVAKTPQSAKLGQSGGSPILQKITPVTSLPNVPEVIKHTPGKDVNEISSKYDSPVDVVPSKPPSTASEAQENAMLQPVHDSTKALKSKDAAEASPKQPSAHRSKKASKSKKQETAKSAPEPKESPDVPETAESFDAVPGTSPENTVENSQPKSKKSKRQKKSAAAPEMKDSAENEPEIESKKVDEPEKVLEEADDVAADVAPNADENENSPKKGEDAIQEEMTTCKKCYETMTKKSLKAHHKLHYEFACKQCTKKYGSEKGLEAHIKKSH